MAFLLSLAISSTLSLSLSLSLADIACKLQRLESALSHCRSLTKRVTCVQTSAARRVILIYGIAAPPGGATAGLELLSANALAVI